MSHKCILLVGKIGSGKTTAANILKKYGFKEETFAEPIKQFAKSIGFTHNQIYGNQNQKLEINKFWLISGREFLQQFGTDLCRNNLHEKIPNMDMGNRTIWVRTMENKIKKYPLIVISDGRFFDEAKLVRDYGGIIIKIYRDKYEHKINTLLHSHKSEKSMCLILEDYKINNNGSIDDLEKSLLKILNKEGIKLNIINKSQNKLLKGFNKNKAKILSFILLNLVCFKIAYNIKKQ